MFHQPRHQRRCDDRARCHHAARRACLQQCQRAFGDHFAGGAIAGVFVTLHAGADLGAVGIFADEEHVVKAVFALFLARAFARRKFGVAERVGLGDRLRHRAARIAQRRHDHLVIDEVAAILMAEQEVGAVHVLRVDWRHDEGRGPGAGRAVIFGHHARWLRRPFKAGGEGKAAL